MVYGLWLIVDVSSLIFNFLIVILNSQFSIFNFHRCKGTNSHPPFQIPTPDFSPFHIKTAPIDTFPPNSFVFSKPSAYLCINKVVSTNTKPPT